MASDANLENTTVARGLPKTVLYAAGVVLFSFIANLIWTPIATVPVVVVGMLADGVSSTLILTSMFGLYIAISTGGINAFLKRMDQSSNSEETGVSREDIEELSEMIRDVGVVLLLILVYTNLLFATTITLAVAFPQYALYIAIFAPVADKYLISITDYSPTLLVIIGLALIIEGLGLTEAVDINAVRVGSPAAFA